MWSAKIQTETLGLQHQETVGRIKGPGLNPVQSLQASWDWSCFTGTFESVSSGSTCC